LIYSPTDIEDDNGDNTDGDDDNGDNTDCDDDDNCDNTDGDDDNGDDTDGDGEDGDCLHHPYYHYGIHVLVCFYSHLYLTHNLQHLVQFIHDYIRSDLPFTMNFYRW